MLNRGMLNTLILGTRTDHRDSEDMDAEHRDAGDRDTKHRDRNAAQGHWVLNTGTLKTWGLRISMLNTVDTVTVAGVEFRWSWGTAILALEKFELMRAPQQFQ